jgi:hypothetical protein
LLDPLRAFVPTPNRASQFDGASQGPILNPYFGSEAEHDTGGVLEYFREHRNPATTRCSSPAAPSRCRSSRARAKSSPRASRPIRACHGATVKLLNYAHATFKEPQQLTRIAYLFAFGYRPDLVIELDGFNETALAYENARSRTKPALSQRARVGRAGARVRRGIRAHDGARRRVVGRTRARREVRRAHARLGTLSLEHPRQLDACIASRSTDASAEFCSASCRPWGSGPRSRRA